MNPLPLCLLKLNVEGIGFALVEPAPTTGDLQLSIWLHLDDVWLSWFQVAAMQGEPEQQQQLVTFDEAAIAAQEFGGRESVKNSFQCNECFKASGRSDRIMPGNSEPFSTFKTNLVISDVQEPAAAERPRGRRAPQGEALRVRVVPLPRLEKAAHQGEVRLGSWPFRTWESVVTRGEIHKSTAGVYSTGLSLSCLTLICLKN